MENGSFISAKKARYQYYRTGNGVTIYARISKAGNQLFAQES
jgi:hypothetical protein